MSLIQKELTVEQKTIKTKGQLDALLLGGAKSLYCFAEQIWVLFWRNPDGLSCQQVFDSFGADGVAMAQMLLSAKLLIDKVDTSIWKLERPGVVTPVLDGQGHPTGHVTVTLNPS